MRVELVHARVPLLAQVAEERASCRFGGRGRGGWERETAGCHRGRRMREKVGFWLGGGGYREVFSGNVFGLGLSWKEAESALGAGKRGLCQTQVELE